MLKGWVVVGAQGLGGGIGTNELLYYSQARLWWVLKGWVVV